MKLSEIKVWCLKDGISHIVQSQVTMGTYTLCGTVMVGDWRRKTRTKRVCAKCREYLDKYNAEQPAKPKATTCPECEQNPGDPVTCAGCDAYREHQA